MEPDYVDIQMERRRQIFFGVVIAIVIIGSIVLYFWGKVLNKGTILIYAEPPFTASFYERKETFECDKSPCEIVQPMGEKSFYVSKEGYETVFDSEKIKLWRTVEKKVDLNMNPHFLKIEDEIVEMKEEYGFAIDPVNQMQKLFEKNDPDQKAIVYFPKTLKKPAAFGNEKMILVVDQGDTAATYRVDVEEESKQLLAEISQFKSITSGKWSNDGRFFIASLLRQPKLWIMNEQGELTQTELQGDMDVITWRKDHEMVVANSNGVFFYDPLEEKQNSITFGNTLDELPSKIFAINNGEKLYVKSGENFYKLILE